MNDIKTIRDEATYKTAVAEVRRLWDAKLGTPEGELLDVLMVLVNDYEEKHHAIILPNPIEAIRIRMDDLGMDRAALGEVLGVSSGRVSDILNKRRRLTLEMVRTLAGKLGLSEACLVQDYELLPTSPQADAKRPSQCVPVHA